MYLLLFMWRMYARGEEIVIVPDTVNIGIHLVVHSMSNHRTLLAVHLAVIR